MSGAKVVGGIIALFCGLLLLVQTITNSFMFSTPWAMGWVVNLGIAGCGIIGGVFGVKGQQGAGAVALIAALLAIVLGIVFTAVDVGNFSWWQYSFFAETLSVGVIYVNLAAGISLEAILLAVGGLVIVASGSD